MSRHPGSPDHSTYALWKSSTATLVVAILAAALTFAACSKDVSPESDQVVLEAAQSSGESPWTQSVTAPVDLSATADTLDSTVVTPLSGGETTTVVGNEPGLYGGSNELSVCDRKQLVNFLQANPEQATAWSDVVGAPDVKTYVDALTPVVLTTDTSVTNHGYSDGRAQPFQSVLQAGTAVLVDDQGVPKVRCECGNPLAEPETNAQSATFVGDRWPKFDPALAVTVVPAPAAPSITVQEIAVVDGAVVGEGQTADVDTSTDPVEQEEVPVDPDESEGTGDEVDPDAPVGDAPVEDPDAEQVPDENTGDGTQEGDGTDGQGDEYPDTGGTDGQGDVEIEPEAPPATE